VLTARDSFKGTTAMMSPATLANCLKSPTIDLPIVNYKNPR
jgi:hypothetical protein